jgi:hypothetical protein
MPLHRIKFWYNGHSEMIQEERQAVMAQMKALGLAK